MDAMSNHSPQHTVQDDESWKNSDFLSFTAADADADADKEESDDDHTHDISEKDDSDARHRTNHEKRPRSDINNKTMSLTSVSSLPPWMDEPHYYKFHRNVPKLVLLHDEIVSFAKLMEPRPEELENRQNFIKEVEKVVKSTFENSQVQIFGSSATGLVLPHSDVDFVVTFPSSDEGQKDESKSKPLNKNTQKTSGEDTIESEELSQQNQKQKERKEMEEYNVSNPFLSSSSPLQILGQSLRDHWGSDLKYLEIVENTRVPIVKFTHGPTNLSGDVCFHQDYGPMAADLVKRFLEAMPPLKPLTYVLKYFVAARGLNEPYSGGCGSFMIQMMIISFLQQRERMAYNERRQNTMNLGAMLLEFFEFYGLDFNFFTTGISIRSDGFFFMKGAKERKEHFYNPSRPYSFAIENPLDITQDVGKPSFRMPLISKSFEVAMRVLLSHTAEPAIPTESILASIIPPTDEMEERAFLRRNMIRKTEKRQRIT
jgi:non-canonical poly(A) RNA polymerase PAPD5/7